MRKPLLTLIVLLQFVSYVAAAPAHASSLPAARALAQSATGEPLSITTTIVVGSNPPVALVAAGVALAAAGVYYGLKALFGGGGSPDGIWQPADPVAERAAMLEFERAQQRMGSAKELEDYTRHLEEKRDAALAKVAAARDALARQKTASARVQRDMAPVLQRTAAQTHNDVQTAETAHNNQLARTAQRLNDAVQQARSQSEPDAGPAPDAPDEPDATTLATRSYRALQTEPGEPGYSNLVNTERYLRSAAMSLTPTEPHFIENASHLALADMAIDEADSQFANGNMAIGNGILEHVRAVTDDSFNYSNVRDRVSRGSTFLAGMISGATGLPGQPLQGYENAWALGQLVGGGLGLAADTAGLISSIATGLGSGGLAIASGGILAPAAAAMAGESAVVATASLGSGVAHIQTIKAAYEKLTEKGSSSPGDPPPSREGAKRLPVEGNNGSWSGERGNSDWHPTNPEVLKHTGGEPVPFKEGHPNFSKWSRAEVRVEGMTGRERDHLLADGVLAEKLGKTAREVKLWRKSEGLTWHHHQDGKTMQLVPAKLHQGVPHSGGASALRKLHRGTS